LQLPAWSDCLHGRQRKSFHAAASQRKSFHAAASPRSYHKCRIRSRHRYRSRHRISISQPACMDGLPAWSDCLHGRTASQRKSLKSFHAAAWMLGSEHPAAINKKYDTISNSIYNKTFTYKKYRTTCMERLPVATMQLH